MRILLFILLFISLPAYSKIRKAPIHKRHAKNDRRVKFRKFHGSGIDLKMMTGDKKEEIEATLQSLNSENGTTDLDIYR